jgi:hypothetical protein
MKIKAPKPIPMKLELLENGLDFVHSGVFHILKDRLPNAHKYAILHMSSGIDLILKERLRQEHWCLIFDDIEKANQQSMLTGDFKSADIETLLTRLEEECGIRIDNKTTIILLQYRKLQNKFEHFQFTENVTVIKSLSCEVLSFLLYFINENFDANTFSDLGKDYIERLNKLSGSLEKFVKLKMDKTSGKLVQLMKYHPIELCPQCQREALVLNEDRTCLFCGFTDTPVNMARAYVENILFISAHSCTMNGGEFPVYDCLHCHVSDTYVYRGDRFVCFNCSETRSSEEITHCGSCGRLFQINTAGATTCDNCQEIIGVNNS